MVTIAGQYKSLLDALDEAIFIIAKDYKILEINEKALQIINCSREEAMGQTCHMVLFNSNEPCQNCPLFQNKLSRNTETIEIYGKNFLATSSPVIDETGEIKFFLYSLRDFQQMHGHTAFIMKKYKNRLTETENRYKNIFENHASPMLIIDPKDGAIIDVNKSALSFYGYSRDKMLKMNIMQINALTPEQVILEMNKAKDRKQDRFYFRHRLANGEIRDVEVYSSPIVFHNKSYLYSLVHDISVQKRQEDDLQQLTSKLLKAQEMAHLGSWSLDIDSGQLKWSDELYKILGYEPQSFSPDLEFFIKHLHPNEKDVIEKVSSSIETHNKYALEISFIKNNGDIINAQCKGELVKRNGKNELNGTILDITDRKNAELEIEKSNFFFHSVINNLQEGVIVYDTHFNYVLWNKKMEEVTEKKAVDVLGVNALEAFPHLKKERVDVIMKRALKGEIIVSHDILYKNPSGKEIWYFSTFSPHFSHRGDIIGIINVLTDITDRKLAEFKVKEKNEELLKANAELDNFVYRVSHDLRAPITSSLGLARLSHKEEDKNTLHYYARLQEESMGKLDKFINDILDYSRNVRMVVDPVKIDMEQMVKDSLEQLNKHLDKKKIQVNINISHTSEFYSDKHRIGIILNNLLSNAFKFANSHQETSRVDISFEADPKKGFLIVKDNGIGIPFVHQDKIFKMFYRATDKTPGSGIGLYIVQDCINKLGGSIGLESDVGKGSSFYVSLPNMGS